jgi:tetratricopeptide (TPR) repeat protein/predicted Ser/Thr protein kinase
MSLGGLPPGEADSAPGTERPLEKGAALGRFLILGLLGRGGMGEVYAAFDPELDRKIAIKLLSARGATAGDPTQRRTRLLREAQAIARLSHPNVVVVYDVGTFEESVFIAMEFIEGNTLGYWLQARPRAAREIIEVFAAAGRGLAAAHAAGIVHRDFKPENVMITKDGQVRVMDFGLARQLGQRDEATTPMTPEAVATALSDGVPEDDLDATVDLGDGRPRAISTGYLSARLTQTGAILGTPAYMAPEQFSGGGCDARTDQFSFCVTLYEALYGERPFDGMTPVELMTNVATGTVKEAPADTRVPAWVRKTLVRGLSVSPNDRHPAMSDLLAALGQDPARARRRRLTLAAGISMIAALTLGAQRLSVGRRAICDGGAERAAQVWGPAQRGAVARAFEATGARFAGQALAGVTALLDRYAAGWTEMYTEACQATQVRGEQSSEVLDLRMECLRQRLAGVRALTDALAQADRAVVDNAVAAAGSLPTLDRCADVAMLRSVIRPPDDPKIRAQVAALREQVSALTTQSLLGRCPKAAADTTALVEAAVAIGYGPLEAEARYALGLFGDSCLDPKMAIESLENAAYVAESSRHDEIAIAAAATAAGMYGDRIKNLDLARHWGRFADAILARFPGHPILEGWLAQARSEIARLEGRNDESLREVRLALALKQQALGDDHIDVALAKMNVGVALHDCGRNADAVPVLNEAIASFRKLGGEDSARLALALADLGEVLTELGRYPEARAPIERSLGIWRSADANSFYVGYGLFKLGELQLAEGNARAARATLEQSLPLMQIDAHLNAEVQFALARALWASPRDRARALTLARQSMSALGGDALTKTVRGRIETWLRAHDG